MKKICGFESWQLCPFPARHHPRAWARLAARWSSITPAPRGMLGHGGAGGSQRRRHPGKPPPHPCTVGNSCLPGSTRCIPAVSTADLLCFMKNEKNVSNEINSEEPNVS